MPSIFKFLGIKLLETLVEEAARQLKEKELEKKHQELSEGSIDVEFEVKEE
uniref:Uncharacterized protein n=1 Tax=viral metagenome TaxID=1070528 RepID=A0A6H2A0R7_9ZZZZ